MADSFRRSERMLGTLHGEYVGSSEKPPNPDALLDAVAICVRDEYEFPHWILDALGDRDPAAFVYFDTNEESSDTNRSRGRPPRDDWEAGVEDLATFSAVIGKWRSSANPNKDGRRQPLKPDRSHTESVCEALSNSGITSPITGKLMFKSAATIYNTYRRIALIQGESGESIADIFHGKEERPGPKGTKALPK